MKNFLVLSISCSALMLPNFASAWGNGGHIAIAAEAYRELSPQLRAQVFEVLKAHPDFQKWQAAYHPNASFDLPAYVFMRSSTWPDEIRRGGNIYDHPNWHFIDYPLRPPAFAFEPDARPTDNVLFGIDQCEKTLSDTNAAPELRAAYMSYLIHLIGDLHQPLHCESLLNDTYPHGDKGGNDFYVRPNTAGVRLHGIWDSLLGSSSNPRTQWNYAIKLDAKFPRNSLSELTQHQTPKNWSLESRQLAIDVGYLHGALQGSTNAETAPSLPPDYTKAAKAVAEKQGALAGYRLADDIQKCLRWSITVAPLAENTNVALVPVEPKRIGAGEASKYYDELMIVTGKVVQVTVRPTITFLNLDAPSPNSPFSAVLFPENNSLFSDIESLKNHDVEITGTITEYHGKPEIILEETNQVHVLP